MKICHTIFLFLLTETLTAHPTPFHNNMRASYNGGPIMNREGKILGKSWDATGAAFDMDGYFAEDRCAVKEKDKWGFIDKNNELVIEAKYDRVFSFREGLAATCLNGKWGFIDKTGEITIPHVWDFAFIFSEGGAGVIKDGKLGFINKKGKLIIPCEYEIDIPRRGDSDKVKFMEGVAVFKHNSQYKIINKKGIKIDLREGLKVFGFSEDLAKTSIKIGDKKSITKYGYINTKGEEVIKPKYLHASPFHKGLAAVVEKTENELFLKYINPKDETIVTRNYEFTERNVAGFTFLYEHLNHDLFPILNDKLYGFINSKGDMVINPKYSYVNGFNKSGLCKVRVGQKEGVIDIKGNYVFPLSFVKITSSYSCDMQDGMILVFPQPEGAAYWYDIKARNRIEIPKK